MNAVYTVLRLCRGDESALININGNPFGGAGITLAEYLSGTSYNPKRIAVEINGEIVPKAQYESTVLHDGDTVEIVSFVGGG